MRARPGFTCRAFTLIELLVVIAIIGILAAIIVPVLARSKMKARITQDLSQLHQFGHGANVWANDHEGHYPWRVDPSEGGSMGSSGPEWAEHIRVMAKELARVEILVCPFERETKKPAPDWASLAGYDNVSYFVGLNAEQSRLTLLSGDAAFVGGTGGVDPYWNSYAGSSIDATWETVHGDSGRGNVVLTDGSAHTWSSRQFKEQIAYELGSGSTNVVLSKPQGTL